MVDFSATQNQTREGNRPRLDKNNLHVHNAYVLSQDKRAQVLHLEELNQTNGSITSKKPPKIHLLQLQANVHREGKHNFTK